MGSVYFYFYQDELLYIGSSMNMRTRLNSHKSDFNTRPNKMKFHRDVKANGLTLDDLELEVIKTEITDKKALLKLEGSCIELYNPICNMRKAGRTNSEYLKTVGRDSHNESNRKYRQTEKRIASRLRNNDARNTRRREKYNIYKEDINRERREKRTKKKLEKLAAIQEEH